MDGRQGLDIWWWGLNIGLRVGKSWSLLCIGVENYLVKKRIDEDSVDAYESGKWWHQVKDFKGSTKDGLGYLN